MGLNHNSLVSPVDTFKCYPYSYYFLIPVNSQRGLDAGDRGGVGYTALQNVDFESHFNLTKCCWWAQIRTISLLKMMPPVC